jgi:hypothetical protein
MATENLEMAPGEFFEALAWPEPDRRHRYATSLLIGAALVLVAAGGLVTHALVTSPAAPRATIGVLAAPQRAGDVLEDDDIATLVVLPASTRLLVTTPQGAHYAALSPSGELCLVRVPAYDLPSEACAPDRVGADETIGSDDSGQVRLVADGAPLPSSAEGWRQAGPNVWVRG